MNDRVAVVTLARGRHAHLAHQHRSLASGSRPPDDYVVVAMDDPAIGPDEVDGLRRRVVRVGADPRGLPLAAARNRGVDAALDAGATTVICLDVDCLAGGTLVAAYAEAVTADPGTVWQGPVTYLPPPPDDGYRLADLDALDRPHPGRPAPAPGERLPGGDPDLFWSLSFAVSPSGWERSGGFHPAYVGYGAEDTDFGQQVLRRGLDLGWDGSARAYHQHHPVSSPPTEHLDDILRNAAIFHERWGRWPMTGWLEEFERLGLASYRDERWERNPAGVRVPTEGHRTP